MNFKEKSVVYPSVHPGTEKSLVRFYSGKVDLKSVFYDSESENKVKRIFVTDTTVANLDGTKEFFSLFKDGSYQNDILVTLGSGEKFKTIESVLKIVEEAIKANAQRNSIFVGIGGGVITDMTAFAASIFKRSAHLELVPTTLLSMVDAAVGGKTGCDFDSYKNMIGSFFPAEKIHVFPQFVQTLPLSEYRSGMAEVVKTALLYDKGLFEKLEANPQILNDRKSESAKLLIEEMIQICVSAKGRVVEEDFTEKGIRMQLNLGHTFGHALESQAGLGSVSHGDAVAWGIGRAAVLAQKMGLCTADYTIRVKKMLSSFTWESGAVHSAMKASCPDKNEAAQKLYAAMKKDKKNATNKIRFVLQKDLESTVICEAEESDVLFALTED